MNNRKLRLFVILLFTAALILTAAACNGKEFSIKIDFDQSTSTLKWSSDGAISYDVKIFREDGSLALQLDGITSNDVPLAGWSDGTYFVYIVAHYKKDRTSEAGSYFTIDKKGDVSGGDNNEDNYDPDYEATDDVESLKTAYYHRVSDKSSLSIGLINDSGVKEVEGFDMFHSSMWSYDTEKNVLYITQTYLQVFSAGAILPIKITYNDGEEDIFDLKIVDQLPLEILEAKNGTIEVDLNSAYALNIKISLGYGDKTLEKGGVVSKVCIDNKKLSTSDYTLSFTAATVSLNYSRVISKLSVGRHKLDIYTNSYGRTEAWINVKDDREYPRLVNIDYDSSYPKIYIEWTMTRGGASGYEVSIGEDTYSSKAYPELFDGNRFDATGKIKYGETAEVKAEFDGKLYSTSSSKAKLDVNVDDSTISKYLSYQNSFEFLGKQNNYFITDFDEFYDMIYYSLLFYDALDISSKTDFEKSVTFYPLKSFLSNESNINSCFVQVENRLNEATKTTRKVESLGNGVYRLHLKASSSFIPDSAQNTTSTLENFFQDTHLSATGRGDDYEGFAVNSIQETASVRYSEELYLALERGVRPVPVAGSSADKIYSQAKRVLRKIISDDMSDYQKIHAMYDWIAKYTTYDWDIDSKMSGVKPSDEAYNKFYKFRQFYLEGVFVDGVAVCNGIAKAMSLMCGIEGIDCYKIKGTSRSGAHAWNKIKAGGTWYVCDPTWANRRYTDPRSGAVKEMLTHYTVLMSESTSGNYYGGAHYENFKGEYTDLYAGEDYNVFANTFFKYNGKLYDYVIENEEDLRALIGYGSDKTSKSGQIVSLDVKCDLEELKQMIKLIGEVDGYFLDATDFNARMDGVSTLIMTHK